MAESFQVEKSSYFGLGRDNKKNIVTEYDKEKREYNRNKNKN